MLGKLDFLVRYWELGARHAQLGEPLSAEERTELLGLMQLVGETELPAPVCVERPSDAHPAQLIGEGSIRAVEIHAVTSTALFVAGALPVSEGASVMLRAVDAIVGVEYVVPCRVAWVAAGSPATMALVVDGAPTRARFDDAPALGGTALKDGIRASSPVHGARGEALTG